MHTAVLEEGGPFFVLFARPRNNVIGTAASPVCTSNMVAPVALQGKVKKHLFLCSRIKKKAKAEGKKGHATLKLCRDRKSRCNLYEKFPTCAA